MLCCKAVMVARYWFWPSPVSLNKGLEGFRRWIRKRVISFEVCCLNFGESMKICAEKLV